MKIAFLIYHEILDERVIDILDDLKIDTYTKWENVVGKTHGAMAHLGTRTYPGHDIVRLLPFKEENNLDDLISAIQKFNGKVGKKDDEIRLYLLPLERIV